VRGAYNHGNEYFLSSSVLVALQEGLCYNELL
jgi:hypothetical protein